MCLEVISRRKPPANGWFWKVLKKTPDGFEAQFAETHYEPGKWYEAQYYSSSELAYISAYPVGFHGFSTKRDALRWHSERQSGRRPGSEVIRRCRFRQAHTRGTIQGMHVIVAQQMKAPDKPRTPR